MIEGNLQEQEWEEYDARLLDDTPFTHSKLAQPRTGNKFLRTSEASPAALQGPFLLGPSGEITSEKEGFFEYPEIRGTQVSMGTDLSELEQSESERSTGNEGEAPFVFENPLEHREFRVDRLSRAVQAQFAKTDSPAWRETVAEAMRAGVKNPKELADLIFFMQHRERVVHGVGQLIKTGEPDFFRLRAEWNLYETIAMRRLNPSVACSVFIPEKPSNDYLKYVNAPTSGRVTLMINGKTSGKAQTEAFDSMQRTVESLGPNDSVYLAAFMLNPTLLTVDRTDMKKWGDLFVKKALLGVKIRILLTGIPKPGPNWPSDLDDLNALIGRIGRLSPAARDNLKYVVSMHPARLNFEVQFGFDPKPFLKSVKTVPTGGQTFDVGTHHQKFMVAKRSGATIAFCGGLDISPQRTPEGWNQNFIWHDTHAMLEGRVAREIEREFVLRWNREKAKSIAKEQPGWKPLENLTLAALDRKDEDAEKNTQKLQVLRTVSVGATTADIRRDDVWQAYFRLIGCAKLFLFIENQYLHEPALANAIVKQSESETSLIVMIVVSKVTDDPEDPFTRHGRAQQNECFKILSANIPKDRLRVYSMEGRLVHSKVIMVDDRALSMGSTNANPRDFFMDTQLNVVLDDPKAVSLFRHKLWSHDLGVSEEIVKQWQVREFFAKWDSVVKHNESLSAAPDKMPGEDVICFDPTTVMGKRSPIADVLTELSSEVAGTSEMQTQGSFVANDRENEFQLPSEQSLEEVFDPSAPPKAVADALAAKNWALALSLAIQAGMRDENELTNFIFFAKHPELPRKKLDPQNPKYKQLSSEWSQILNGDVWTAIQASSENTSLVLSGTEVADIELQESASEGEDSRSSENAESSASENIAGTEHADFYGESAPWLREDPFGGDRAEYEWRNAPSKKKVSDTFAAPFRWICKVSVLKNGKYDGGGSGVLISDRHVLTAAHVVYDVIHDPVQYDLEVYVAQDGNKDLGMFARSGKPCIPSQYDPDKGDFDYALITLSSPVGQSNPDGLKGVKLCFWGSPECGAGTVLVRVEPKTLVTQNAWTAGYPRNKGQSAMWCFTGILAYVGEKNRTMVYTGELTEGQSGSPVWIQRDGKYILVGIAVARGTVNKVVRVTRELCRQLASWMGTQQHEVAEDRLGGDFESEGAVIGQNASPLSIFEVSPSELADLEEHQVAPQGLILLDHVHKPKTPDPRRPGAFAVGALAKLTASDLNPLFIDARDSLITDTTPTGLQRCLNALISSGFEGLLGSKGQTTPGPHDRVHVALVDLTGTKLTAPEFAGWGATTDVNGASVPKIAAVYGAFQLRFELRDLVTRRSPADGNQLESMAVAEWRAKGLAAQLPDLVWLFNIRKWSPAATLDFTPDARSAIAHLVHNCEAGTLVVKVSLPYIGSLAWQSGLFHPTRSGLWLKSAYCSKGDWDSPVKVSNVHNVTALSAATYFTLLAQRRLVDDASSASIATALRHGCVTNFFPPLPVVASKCGILDGLIHDCAWIQDRNVRYAIAVLSKLEAAAHQHLYTRLCGELDTLIRMNNQIPKSPCLP